MGLKRIMFMAEVTYPADDARSLEELAIDTSTAVSNGVGDPSVGGSVARLFVQSAAQDPDPEDSFTPEPPPAEPSPE